MKKSIYFKLQLKRAFKHYPSVLLVNFIAILGIVAILATLFYVNNNGEDKQRINIGIVGNLADSHVDVAVYALENMDEAIGSVKFIELSEKEAKMALEKREIVGYVQVPGGYFEDMAYGENSAATYVSAQSPDDLGNIMANELAMMLSYMVVETQKGIYSAIEIAEDKNATKDLYIKIDDLNFEYMRFVLNRQQIYETEYLGVKDRLTYGGYYVCGIFVFFLMMWGISCNRILSSKNYGLYRSVYIRGIKGCRQVLGEYAGYFIITFITFLFVFTVAGVILSINDFGIREFAGADIFYGVTLSIKMIPVIAMFTAMHFMIYEIFSNIVSCVLVQFVVAAGLGYVSGCFYPNTFFPKAMQQFTSYLPSGAGFSYAGKMLTGENPWADFAVIAAYIALFILTSCAVRIYRLKGDGWR